MRVSKLWLAGLTGVILGLSTSTGMAVGERRAFTYYPGFVLERSVVEAATDKGLMVELIVRCSSGVGIVTYSKAERLYCGPDHRCGSKLKPVVARLCR